MNILMIVAASIGFVLPTDNEKESTGKEIDKLQGEWVLIETADEQRPDRGDPNSRMVISGKTVTLKFHELTMNSGSFEVGFSRKARSINMKLGEETKTWLGIYELHGDYLTICFDQPGKGRPTSLMPKGTQWAEKWKRVKP